MIGRLILFGLLSLCTKADILNDKIINLVGEEKYILNTNLINEITKDTRQLILNNKINYEMLLKILKKDELINTNIGEQREVKVLFKISKSHKKGLKIIKNVLANLGYSYYFIDFIKNVNGILALQIRFKDDFIIDPLFLFEELSRFSTKIIDINKIEQQNWEYTLDVQDGMLNEALHIIPNQNTVLEVPLQPYILSLQNAIELIILSNKMNSWVPKMSFYDSELNSLGTIETDRIYEGIKVAVPKNSKYVKISDRYSLSNIKRGISITISNIDK